MKRGSRVQWKKRAAAVKGWFSFVYSRRFWKWAGGIAAIIVGIQFVIPHDLALPFATLDGVNVGGKTIAEITQQATARYADAHVITREPQTSTTFAEAGVAINARVSAQNVVEYPWWQRVIPLSIIIKLVHHGHASSVQYQKLSIDAWADSVRDACASDAADAGIEIRGGELTVKESQTGRECNKKQLVENLSHTPLQPELVVETKPVVVQPKRSDAQVAAQIHTIQALIDKGITVTVLGNTVRAQPDEIVQWLSFTDGQNGQLKLDVDPAKMQDFVARVQRPVYTAPGTTVVTMRDGVETGRVSGTSGQGVDQNDLIAQLRSALNQSKKIELTAKVSALAPKVTYQRSYTNSTPGLQALLNDIAAEHSDMAIALTEVDGQRRSVGANGEKQYHPASTYKLFVAYGVIKRIEAGQWKWDEQVNGTSVDECLTRMIVNSDNACAEAFADKMGGWGAVQTDVKSTGATGTNLNLAEPVGTVKDQVNYLVKLQGNQLMKQENRDKLLVLMKRQQYRSGIPAGVNYEVADKVGFLSGYLHDSGLVYTPHGTYALSIYSKGGSWGNIADAARRIEALLAS